MNAHFTSENTCPVNITVVVPSGSSHHMPARLSDKPALWVPAEEFGLPEWGLGWFLIDTGRPVWIVLVLESLASGFGFPVTLSSPFSSLFPSPLLECIYDAVNRNKLFLQSNSWRRFLLICFFLSGFLVHFPSLYGTREWTVRCYLSSSEFQSLTCLVWALLKSGSTLNGGCRGSATHACLLCHLPPSMSCPCLSTALLVIWMIQNC